MQLGVTTFGQCTFRELIKSSGRVSRCESRGTLPSVVRLARLRFECNQLMGVIVRFEYFYVLQVHARACMRLPEREDKRANSSTTELSNNDMYQRIHTLIFMHMIVS